MHAHMVSIENNYSSKTNLLPGSISDLTELSFTNDTQNSTKTLHEQPPNTSVENCSLLASSKK